MEKKSMAWYFDIGIERGALLLDASNLDWFEFPLYDCVRKEIYRTLEDPSEDMDWGYSYPGGKKNLRKLIAIHESYLEKAKITEEDVIVVGNGVTGVFNFISQFLLKESQTNHKNQIIYPVPAYAGLMKSIEYYGLIPVIFKTLRSNNFCPTHKEVVNCYNDKVAAIILSNPGNPACNLIDDEELKKIIDFAREKDIYVIIDSIFEESPSIGKKHFRNFNISDNYEKLIKIKGFSKDTPQLGDLRLGWSVSKNNYFNYKMLELNEITNFSNSTFLESLAIVEMQYRVWSNSNENDESIQKYKREKETYQNKIISGLSLAIEYLKEINIVEDIIIPDVGNILFIKISDSVKKKTGINNSHDMFVYILEKANILITPGHVFGIEIEELWFRVTMSRNEVLFYNGLKKIISVLEE
jgi:aspartate/methionine/tyrosine aminotransferase